MKFTIVLFIFFAFFSSCQKDIAEEIASRSEQTIRDVSYGPDPQQKMDVYLPAGRNTTSTKVMVLIHGGGWNGGDKSDFNAYVDTLKRRDPSYAIFNIGYRLANAPHLFPAQENDIKAAIEFITGRSHEYGVSQKLVLIGASAGAHLALLQAYKYPSPVKVKAVIDFFGPTDLISLYNTPSNPLIPLLLLSVTGYTPASNPAIYNESSPVNFITPQSPPTLILHGGLDIVVSPFQSQRLKNELQAHAVVHDYVLYPTEGHGWVGPNLTDSFNRIAAFLAAHVP